METSPDEEEPYHTEDATRNPRDFQSDKAHWHPTDPSGIDANQDLQTCCGWCLRLQVRAEAAQALNASLAHQHKSSGASTLTEPAQLSTMLQLAGKLISDAQPKARAAAQEMCEQLRSAVCEGKNEEEAAAAWEGACKKELSSTAAAKVLKLCK